MERPTREIVLQVKSDSERLIIRDHSGWMWVLGLMFLAGGSLVLLALWFGVRPNSAAWVPWAIAAIGIAHVSTGAWLLTSSPGIRVTLRYDRLVLELTRRWLVLRRTRVIHLDEMRGFYVHKTEDSDGDDVFYLELDLRNGETVRLHSVAVRSREAIVAAADRLRVWSGGRLAQRIRSPGIDNLV